MAKLAKMIRVFYIGGAKTFTTEKYKFTQARNFNDMTVEESNVFKGRYDFRLADIEEPLSEPVSEVPECAPSVEMEEVIGDVIKEVVEAPKAVSEDIEIPDFCKGCEEWAGCKGSTLPECIELEEDGDEEVVEEIKKEKKVKKVVKKKK